MCLSSRGAGNGSARLTDDARLAVSRILSSSATAATGATPRPATPRVGFPSRTHPTPPSRPPAINSTAELRGDSTRRVPAPWPALPSSLGPGLGHGAAAGAGRSGAERPERREPRRRAGRSGPRERGGAPRPLSFARSLPDRQSPGWIFAPRLTDGRRSGAKVGHAGRRPLSEPRRGRRPNGPHPSAATVRLRPVSGLSVQLTITPSNLAFTVLSHLQAISTVHTHCVRSPRAVPAPSRPEPRPASAPEVHLGRSHRSVGGGVSTAATARAPAAAAAGADRIGLSRSGPCPAPDSGTGRGRKEAAAAAAASRLMTDVPETGAPAAARSACQRPDGVDK